jgi:ATP-binding protein involved in chromosome partitioning
VIAEADIRGALRSVQDPCSVVLGDPVTIEDLGLIEQIVIDGPKVCVHLVLTIPNCVMFLDISASVRAAIQELEGVQEVDVRLDHQTEWTEDRLPEAARQRLAARRRAYRSHPDVKPRGAHLSRRGAARGT